MKNEVIRPFLKWPGGKFRLIDEIRLHLPAAKQLIEPFVGSGAVFLNTKYDRYLLNDANQDLITLYKILQSEGKHFIKYCKTFFTPNNNMEKKYYQLRSKFNATEDLQLKSALFLYLNRHGYNGLCRYNKCKKAFNVPFGRYKKPYFPEREMQLFFEKSKQAIFICEDFTKTFHRSRKGSVVYCDPPYVPLNNTANFTHYQSGGFTLEQQRLLAQLAKKTADKNIPVLLSNHATTFTHTIYKDAHIKEFSVQRFISCKSDRKSVLELLALFSIFPV